MSSELLNGRYRLHRILGEGGFAVVHLATDEQTGAEVAVKILKDPADDRATAIRFQREVAIVAALRSPYVVGLVDQGETPDGELFAVFEYVPGRDLDGIVKEQGRLERSIVIKILRQLLQGLAQAHGAGLLHRDIKPQNIRVFEHAGDPWCVKLLDFGIARSTDDSHPSVTATGMVMGTPRYMSPEQLRGRSLSSASDVYSVGLVGIELLAGAEALPGGSVQHQLDRLMTGHVVNIPLRDPDDLALAGVLNRMTSVHPEERVRTANAALKALNDLEHPTEAPTIIRTGPQAPRAREPESPARLAAVVLVVTALIAVIAVVLVLQNDNAPIPAQTLTPPRALHQIKPEPKPSTPAQDAGEPDADGFGCADVSEPGMQRAGSFDIATYVPSSLRPADRVPLLLLANHYDGPAAFIEFSGFIPIAEREKFLIAAPHGADHWRAETRPHEVLRSAIESLSEDLCVDSSRVFLVGYGKGGRAALAGANVPEITAAASVAGLIAETTLNEEVLWSEKPKPWMMILPADSGFVRLDGERKCIGPTFSLAATEQHWLRRNGLEDSPIAVGEMCRRWKGQHPLQVCVVPGGYVWPGREATLRDNVKCPGETPMRAPIAEIMWEFFASLSAPDAE